jgi:hypothetical protein
MVTLVASALLLWRKYDVNVTSIRKNDDTTRFTKMAKIAQKHAKIIFRGHPIRPVLMV